VSTKQHFWGIPLLLERLQPVFCNRLISYGPALVLSKRADVLDLSHRPTLPLLDQTLRTSVEKRKGLPQPLLSRQHKTPESVIGETTTRAFLI